MAADPARVRHLREIVPTAVSADGLFHEAGAAPAPPAVPFTDASCRDVVTRASQTGVIEGTSPTTFSPTAPVTRGQLVAFLCRARELRIADPSLIPGSASTDPSASPAV